MEIQKKYKTAMERQLAESICIAKAGGMESEFIMNSKDEYSHCIIPEIILTGSRKMSTSNKRDRGEETGENENPLKRIRRMKEMSPRGDKGDRN